MNPARSIGPAVVATEWTGLWIYVSAPVAGALAGALPYQAIRGPRETTVEAAGARSARSRCPDSNRRSFITTELPRSSS